MTFACQFQAVIVLNMHGYPCHSARWTVYLTCDFCPLLRAAAFSGGPHHCYEGQLCTAHELLPVPVGDADLLQGLRGVFHRGGVAGAGGEYPTACVSTVAIGAEASAESVCPATI